MSKVFSRGRMRLYLLKLLAEQPRHGYELIRVLEERLGGTWAASPGSVYPRLRRLEEEGLLTHADRGGRKIYSLTPAGEAEVRERADEVAALDNDIRQSVDILADEMGDDVSTLVRSVRGELTEAARDLRRGTGRWKLGSRPRAIIALPARNEADDPLREPLDELTARTLRLAARTQPTPEQVARCKAVLNAATLHIADILMEEES